MFWDKLFNRRTHQAFKAIDEGDLGALSKLLDAGLSPNTTRRAVLENHTFNWEEFLLTRAVRQDQYDAALLLLDRGANPHVHDFVSGDLLSSLVATVSRSKILNNDPHPEYSQHPVLHCLVALDWHRTRVEPLKNLGPRNTILDEDTTDRRPVFQWLETVRPVYAAHQLNKTLTDDLVEQSGTSTMRHRKM